MKISTRGRYALRVMVDLAERGNGNFMPLKEISARQDISQKYLESIMLELSKAGLVEGQHGKGGGYKLLKSPENYTAGEILRVMEGELAPVACLESNAAPCAHAADCRTLPLWKNLYELLNNYFNSVTLADLMQKPEGNEYFI